MNAHLRANLLLLGLTVFLCCILYPLTLWSIGQICFPNQASGSLIDKNGNPTNNESEAAGSRLIAQPFNGPEYFHPRPSAPSYDASVSGGSNLSATNPKLRARVAQALGPIVKYRTGPKKDQLVGPDIEQWVAENRFKAVGKGTEVQRDYFDRWLTAHPDVALIEVPADGLMASGSGLDPHITLKNARYQLDRVVTAWAAKTKADKSKVRKTIEDLLNSKSEAPLGGLAGVKLINVLEVNLALRERMAGF
ncbi:MAG TPA: potassium-transporting ATPase subunit C [Gemmataceae bacterium]|nr:potassium-transporting ATPase subunit C [Gemmataceae bacterium]